MQQYVLGGYTTVSIHTGCCCPGYANYLTTTLSCTIEPLLTLIRIYLIKLSRRTFHNPVALVKLDLYLYWKLFHLSKEHRTPSSIIGVIITMEK